jgi:hypothetical protein
MRYRFRTPQGVEFPPARPSRLLSGQGWSACRWLRSNVAHLRPKHRRIWVASLARPFLVADFVLLGSSRSRATRSPVTKPEASLPRGPSPQPISSG